MSHRHLGVYVHVPFCPHVCDYCEFTVLTGASHEVKERYLVRLLAEIEEYGSRGAFERTTVATLYIGGGTPTMLTDRQMARLLERLVGRLPVAGDAEVTVEIHPAVMTDGKQHVFKAFGVNRLSVGVQSFDPGVVGGIGRRQDAGRTIALIHSLREAGFENLNADFMYGLPGQDLPSLLASLDHAVALKLPHLSLYSCGIKLSEANAERLRRKRHALPSPDGYAAMRREALRLLEAAGYRQDSYNYFVLAPAHRYRHAFRFWQGGNVIGLGCSAYSYVDGVVYENRRSLERYVAEPGLPIARAYPLSRLDQMRRYLCLGLNQLFFVDRRHFRELFGASPEQEFGGVIAGLVGSGRLVEEGDLLVIPPPQRQRGGLLMASFTPFDDPGYQSYVSEENDLWAVDGAPGVPYLLK